MSQPDPWGEDREERQAEREQAAAGAEAKRRELDTDILLTFSTPQGRHVYEWLEETCYAYRSVFAAVAGAPNVDPAASHRNEGRRTVWCDVHNAMKRAREGSRPAPEVRSTVSKEG